MDLYKSFWEYLFGCFWYFCFVLFVCLRFKKFLVGKSQKSLLLIPSSRKREITVHPLVAVFSIYKQVGPGLKDLATPNPPRVSKPRANEDYALTGCLQGYSPQEPLQWSCKQRAVRKRTDTPVQDWRKESQKMARWKHNCCTTNHTYKKCPMLPWWSGE